MQLELMQRGGAAFGAFQTTFQIPSLRLPQLLSMRCSFQQSAQPVQMICHPACTSGGHTASFISGMGSVRKFAPGEWFKAFFFSVKDEESIGAIVEALRPLRQFGVLRTPAAMACCSAGHRWNR